MIPYYLKNVKANIYNLSLATEFAEFLASIACLFVQERMDLKKALTFFCSLIALGSFGMLFIAEDMVKGENSSNWNVLLILMTNLGIVAAFDVAYMINAQLFPTVMLATAYGCCNVLGRLVTIGAPVVAVLPQPWPLVVLLAFAFISGTLSMHL